MKPQLHKALNQQEISKELSDKKSFDISRRSQVLEPLQCK